ncbi:MAG: hypothetical protein V7L20_06565 [Nostoc sp.]
MSIAIAEVIVAQAPWTAEILADDFVRVLKRDEKLRLSSMLVPFSQRN